MFYMWGLIFFFSFSVVKMKLTAIVAYDFRGSPLLFLSTVRVLKFFL